MRIKELALQNIGLYAGRCHFIFHPNKPVVLIGGMNGRGKTTFLDAVLLAMYGSASPAYEDSSYKTYGQYLRSITNVADKSGRASVALTIEERLHDTPSFEEITVQRSWDISGKRVHDEITVYKDGEIDAFLTDNWESYIEGILPRALSQFFFFDGEKISRLAEEDTGKELGSSIKALMGVSTVDQLLLDLDKLARRVEKRTTARNDVQVLTDMQETLISYSEELKGIDAAIGDNNDALDNLSKSREIIYRDMLSRSDSIIERRSRLDERLTGIEKNLEGAKERAISLSAGVAPLGMLRENIAEIAQISKAEVESRTVISALNRIVSIVPSYTEQHGSEEEIMRFLDYVKNAEVECGADTKLEPSSTAVDMLNKLLNVDLPGSAKIYQEITQEQSRLEKDAEETRSYLAVESDEEFANRATNAIHEIDAEINKKTQAVGALMSERSSVNGNFIRLNAKYKREREAWAKEQNSADDNLRIIEYIAVAKDILSEYKSKLQQAKSEKLGRLITKCYLELSNKSNLINEVRVNPSTLDISYFDPSGSKVDKARLSAGEKQLMVIAILWALALSAERKLPVIIDTPLARMDSAHRMSLVKTYFPNASDQVIILSTDSEVVGKYYDAIKPNVSDEYLLLYDDSTRSTSIEKGYFSGEVQ